MSLLQPKERFVKCYKHVFNGCNANSIQNAMMGGLMVVGLCHLRTLFSTYEQFISVFWIIFFLDSVHNLLSEFCVGQGLY